MNHIYPHHPAAAVFPMMSDREYAELVDSIRTSGLREPIWLTADERVLDGRNRLKACAEAGVTPEFRTYEGDDPVKFVVDLNLHRRHLSESQRAMVAANLANLSHGVRADLAGRPANLQVFEDMPAPLPPVTQRAAADLLNVSERTVANAAKAKDHGVPELADAVAEGKVKVSAAAQIADLSEPEQREVIAADDEKAIRERYQEIAAARTNGDGSSHFVVFNLRQAPVGLIKAQKPPAIWAARHG